MYKNVRNDVGEDALSSFDNKLKPERGEDAIMDSDNNTERSGIFWDSTGLAATCKVTPMKNHRIFISFCRKYF
jgi:hypothetical protein